MPSPFATMASVSPAGSEVSYTIPDDTSSIALQVTSGTDVTLHTTSGGTGWPIGLNEKEAIDSRNLAGNVIYFNGTGTVVIRIMTGEL